MPSDKSIYRTKWARERKKVDPAFRDYCREKNRESANRIKLDTLTHYGKGGKLKCCWRKCQVTDIDMLSLDHEDDSGAKKRKEGERTGARFYGKLRTSGFPTGYQTLCYNHQWKKELMRKRANWKIEAK